MDNDVSKNNIPPELEVSNTKNSKTADSLMPTKDIREVIVTPKKTTLDIEIPVESALSIKGIKQKKALSKKKKKVVEDPKDLPKSPFTYEQALELWNTFGKRMDKKGERIIGSMFAMNKPKLIDNFILELELPNETMRVDIENIKTPFLTFIQEELNNYSVSLQVVINETIAKKHAFTPQDKYDKLKEENRFIDKLRAKFDLDL